MQVNTNIIDVLPDGTITRSELGTDVMVVTICRSDPDQRFTIKKVDVIEENEMKKLALLADRLREYCIDSIELDCVDVITTILKI